MSEQKDPLEGFAFDSEIDEKFDPNMTENDIEVDSVKSMQALVTMKGFFNRKVRYRIESVHDFVLKL
jgi:hypothetical protein